MRQLGKAAMEGLNGGREGLSKLGKDGDESKRKQLERHDLILSSAVRWLAELERDIDARLGTQGRPGCDCEEFRRRCLVIHGVVSDCTLVVASSPGLSECPC